jgi:hypothetical protein
MSVQPPLVSKEAAQRSGNLPASIPVRRASRQRPREQQHPAAQLNKLCVSIAGLVLYQLKLK